MNSYVFPQEPLAAPSPALRVLILLACVFFSMPVFAQQDRSDYDLDDDGLIEINDLTDLNDIHNHLDGAALYGTSVGCPVFGCRGFELTANLDFDTNSDGVITELDGYWNQGLGWQPIGDANSAFTAEFNGNGHQIRNLFIHRPNENLVALFGSTRGATFKNLGLTGKAMRIHGKYRVGALAATLVGTVDQSSSVIQSYATGSVYGEAGELGSVGGLVGGAIKSTISRSYSLGGVYSQAGGGGLIGSIIESSVLDCFSASEVQGDSMYVGGLIGFVSLSSVERSFAIGAIRGESAFIGGMVGHVDSNPSVVLDSYWDTQTSGQISSDLGVGYTTQALQCAQSEADENCTAVLYSNWQTDVWDFGTTDEYPVLFFNGIPARDTDEDDVWDFYDAFPDNPAASLDEDNDQRPDQWHTDCDETCQQQSGLTLDDEVSENEDLDEEEADGNGSLAALIWLLLPLLWMKRCRRV